MSRTRISANATGTALIAAISLLASLFSAPPVAAAAPQSDDASSISVLSEGEVRFADRLVDGQLELGLRDVSTDTPQWLDPSQTIIHLPTQDNDWLCRQDKAASCRAASVPFWEAIAPQDARFWTSKTNSPGVPGNSLVVNFDAGLVPTSQVIASPEFTFGGLDTTSEDGYMVMWPYKMTQPVRKWDSRINLKDPFTARTSETGEVLKPSPRTLVTFSAPGIYHLTIDTSAYAAADGAPLKDSAVFTFVIGSEIDPSTVTPAPQPEGGPSDSDDDGLGREDGVTVFKDGDLRIAPVLEDGEYALRVADHSGAAPRLLGVEDAIFYLPNQDTSWPGEAMSTPDAQQRWDSIVPRGTLPWRTRGNAGQSSVYARNNLILSLDGSRIPFTNGEEGTKVSLQSANGSGYFASYQVNAYDEPVSGLAPVWDSRSATDRPIGVTKRVDSGWLFSAPGAYCVTLRSELGARLAAATFTVVVGDALDPRSVPVCEQESAKSQHEDEGAARDDLDPTVTYLDHGHTDLAVGLIDDELKFGVDVHEFYDLNDTVWVGQSAANKFTVPSVSSSRDYSFIGEPGDTYWGFTETGNDSSARLWPGLSTQMPGLASKMDPNSVISFNLLGVAGPGDVTIFGDNAATDGKTSDVYWSSAQGYPQSRSFERGNHSHMNWAFTEQGVYCLNWQANMRLKDQSSASTSAQLTVVVGDQIDLSKVQPCGRDRTTPAPVGSILTPSELSTEAKLLTSGQALVSPYLRDGDLDVFARVQDSTLSKLVPRDVESLIFSAARRVTGGPWGFDGWLAGNEGYSAADISWDTTWLDHAQLNGDPLLSVGNVQGPGVFSATRLEWLGAPYIPNENALALGNAPNDPLETTLRAGWRERHIVHSFSKPGVYCVPLTWEVSLADGGTSSVSKTLTFVAGDTDPSAAEYIDRSTVAPCAAGGAATNPGGSDPGSGEEDPEPPIVDVPDSDAAVLSSGHVDVASLIEDGRLVTKVKDDTTGSNSPVFHNLNDVVFHVTSLAERPIPASDEFSFLGTAGKSTWLLPATQDSLLLWPGWSTELIPSEQLKTDITWRLTDVSGPGDFALFETGAFGVPRVLWNTRDGLDDADSFDIHAGVHAHGNWAFSAEGVYCLAFDRTGTLADGGAQTASSVLAVAVGDVDPHKVDPATCFKDTDTPGDGSDPDDNDDNGDSGNGSDTGDPGDPDDTDNPGDPGDTGGDGNTDTPGDGSDGGDNSGSDTGDPSDPGGTDDPTDPDNPDDPDDKPFDIVPLPESGLSGSLSGVLSAATAVAKAGTTFRVFIGGAAGVAEGDRLAAFIYSTPVRLKSTAGLSDLIVQKAADGRLFVDVVLPADYSGDHKVALYDEHGLLLGWVPVNILAPIDDSDTDKTDRNAPNKNAPNKNAGGGSADVYGGLASTGVETSALVALIAVFALTGVVLSMLRRKSAK
ncbi:choice-of-anchor M domain-containing protein [Bifidobacterium aquikefiricola]|uniref:Choice-of-anchor M domain-containing protein n=1 Tax=Bifidobacterium aquikefiricola TaxID=3059038 RepID=A0AB39U819_9BIFI